MKLLKTTLSLLLLLALLLPLCPAAAAEEPVQTIVLSSEETDQGWTHSAAWNGNAVPEYDYAWHADPSQAHEDVKNSPAEYYTGTEPGEEAVYIAHDIIYYPELDQSKFQQVNYDGEMEWAYAYEAEGYEQYLFSTLPVLRSGFPSHMMHTAEEAWDNAVLHITQPGTYSLTGQWHGQIWIDLGDEDDVYADPTQKVTLILNGVDITCTVAPGVVFYSVYECDNAWETADSYSHNVDTADAGAHVVLEAGTVNQVSGTNVFRILKTKFKDEESTEAHPAQKKSWKIDGAFYSYQSLNISGAGTLNIIAGYEGLDTEHHLTLNSGNVNIFSQDDGVNVNEDGVSVVTINGGNLHICAGLGAEGDGIDSNGFLTINGGTVIAMANPASDSGLDSDCGSFVNGGTVVALGSTMDWAESDSSQQPVLNLRFSTVQSADEAIVITGLDGNVAFAYDPDKDEAAGDNRRTYQGAIVSAPGLTLGGSYQIQIGGDVEGMESSGVYDPATVTGFSGGTLQVYSGNELGGFAGGGFGGMNRPQGDLDEFPGFSDAEIPSMPQGMTPPDGMEWPEGDMGTLPEGMERPEGNMGTLPEGMERPDQTPQEGFEPDQRPDGMGGFSGELGGATCMQESVFTLEDPVNGFSGVMDLTHSLQQEEQTGEYLCEACGSRFVDPEGTTLVTGTDPATEDTLLPWILSGVLAAVALAALLLLGLVKKKKTA